MADPSLGPKNNELYVREGYHLSTAAHSKDDDHNSSSSILLIDLQRNGWDDSAIESTWNKALTTHFYSSSFTQTTDQFISFHSNTTVSSVSANNHEKNKELLSLDHPNIERSNTLTQQVHIPCPPWAIL